MPENKTSHFPASIPGCQILQTAGDWSPIIYVLYNSPRVWGGLKRFTPFYFTPQLSIILFASQYPDAYSLTASSINFSALISLNWRFKHVVSLSSGMRPLVKVPQPQVMWRRWPESISLQVCCALALSQTPPVGQKHGAGQDPHSDPM